MFSLKLTEHWLISFNNNECWPDKIFGNYFITPITRIHFKGKERVILRIVQYLIEVKYTIRETVIQQQHVSASSCSSVSQCFRKSWIR